MSYNYLPLDRKWLHFQQVKNLLDYNQQVSITFDAHERILTSRNYLDSISAGNNSPNPGTNNSFEVEQDDQLNPLQVQELQENLLKKGAGGSGEEVPADIVKLMLMLKIKSLSYGYSGVQIDTVKRLMEMYNNEVLPVVYTQGVGASLSHLSLPLIGLGKVYYKGEKQHSFKILSKLKWQPISLQSKEGLALITGTQFTSAYGMYALKKAEQLIRFADVIAALSFDTCNCSIESLNEKIHAIRSHKGQVDTAATISQYLKGSEIANQGNYSIPDPYSFTCTPQVHGATKDTFNYVLGIFLKEINSVTENPVIFPGDDLIIDAGNFSEQPLALALDFLCIAINELANISEKRTNQLINGNRELPQATAEKIISENKQLCTPASINSHEDYISTGANAATKCMLLIDNVEKVLAIELMSAARAIELKRPAQTSPFLEQLLSDFRQHVPFGNNDRDLHDGMVRAIEFIGSYKLPAA